MTAECERRAPTETGGVLMGYRADGSDETVATHVIGPGPNAIHEKFRFVPDHDYQLAEIARLYESSGRRLEYLGDWHSHPDAEGYLSGTDLETLARIARSRTARVEKPVMLVMGGRGGWNAFAWVQERAASWIRRGKPIVRQLKVELFD
jgi:integrative and conjugative element protein (TIGR02256 family)